MPQSHATIAIHRTAFRCGAVAFGVSTASWLLAGLLLRGLSQDGA